MDKSDNGNDYLAKWAAGSLSLEEEERFSKTEDFHYYNAILKGTDLLEVPAYDRERLYKKTQHVAQGGGKVRTLRPNRWMYATAASILLAIGLFAWFNRTVHRLTSYGEQLAVQLPDASEALLNANAELTYKPWKWDKKRVLTLRGQAYFKVKTGSDFIVKTNQGTVKVLGTKFTVRANEGLFEVICFGGKVSIVTDIGSTTLEKGMVTRVVDGHMESLSLKEAQPSWINNESRFYNAPLYQVVTALENQYGIEVAIGDVDIGLRFTGTFVHDNLNLALTTVFEPLDISFQVKDGHIVVLGKK